MMDERDGHDGEIKRHDSLDRLRGLRGRGDRGRGVGGDCDALMRSLKRVSRDQGAVVDAWGAGVPDDLRDVAWVVGLKNGRLEVGVSSAAVRYRVDRWLGTGGLELIREIGKVRVKSVVLRIEEL